VLKDACEQAALSTEGTPEEMLTRLVNASAHQYLIAENRAKMFGGWLSRIADARYIAEKRSAPPLLADGDKQR
jgi:hypothetical protein